MLGIKTRIQRYLNRRKLTRNSCDINDSLKIIGTLSVCNQGVLKIGKNALIRSGFDKNVLGGGKTKITVDTGAVLKIGDNVGISNTVIYCGKQITIGNDVMIGAGCLLMDSDCHSINYTDRIKMGDINVKMSPIVINDGAFVGTRSIILKGVRIGKNAVVGAGSVVVCDVPDNQVWAGNPAKFVKNI